MSTASDADNDDGGELPSAAQDEPTCPICLESCPRERLVSLPCAHTFCAPCMKKLVRHVRSDGATSFPCPCCKHTVRLSRPVGADSAPRARAGPAAPPRPWWRQEEARRAPTYEEARAFAHGAGRVELRLCPGCNTPIQKDGGCNQMRCLCGTGFQWKTARPLVPCRGCHIEKSGSWFWGSRWTVCAHCSSTARAQAVAARVGAKAALAPVCVAGGALGVSAVTAVAAVGVAVAAVPAATVGPFALAYEPIRRLRRKKRNPLAKAAASGAFVVAAGIFVCLMAGHESD